MYDITYYTPINKHTYGKSIHTYHGVTQGRKTSANVFSFNTSDMPSHISVKSNLLDNIQILQLADDTALLAENFESLRQSFVDILKFSKSKYMIANIEKTFYLEMNSNPSNTPLIIDDETYINPAENGKYVYLGMLFIPTNDITALIRANLKHRSYNIKKYHEWLEVNENTPIKIKLQVLDACMLTAYLYGSETWWKIDEVADDILIQERKLLKRILGVKQGTSNDLIYIELGRCDIISRIKDLQFKFNEKINKATFQEAILAHAYAKCKDLQIISYYTNLRSDNKITNKTNRINSLNISNSTTCIRYRQLCNPDKINPILYDSYNNDKYRTIITRWRLSNFDLHIEKGRYNQTPRELRLCNSCQQGRIEDEHHVIFDCSLYKDIREKYREYLLKNNSVKLILDPISEEDFCSAAKLLIDIESIRM